MTVESWLGTAEQITAFRKYFAELQTPRPGGLEITDLTRAQRWHDTDHGALRAPAPASTRFHLFVDAPEPAEQISSCWCCCRLCDPAGGVARWGGVRPNPYWGMGNLLLHGTHDFRK